MPSYRANHLNVKSRTRVSVRRSRPGAAHTNSTYSRLYVTEPVAVALLFLRRLRPFRRRRRGPRSGGGTTRSWPRVRSRMTNIRIDVRPRGTVTSSRTVVYSAAGTRSGLGAPRLGSSTSSR